MAAVLLLTGLTSTTVTAQAFDPVNELFRWGPAEHLIIDRGGPVDVGGDINGDGLPDLLVGAGKGSIRVIFGPTRGNNGVLNGQQLDGNIGFVISHDSQQVVTLSGAADFNGDGLDDVLIGLDNSAHVIFGSRSAFDNVLDVSELDGDNGFTIATPTSSVSDAGDVNADGIDDILIGYAKASVNGLTGSGITYVVFGDNGNWPATLNPQSLDGSNGFAIIGNNTEARSGKHVGKACDFNADGVDDILIGAPNKTQGNRSEAGEAYLVLGSRAGFPPAISLSDIDGNNGFVFTGSNIQDSAGASLSCIGDLNHDGIQDIAIGAPGKGPFGSPSDYPGEIYVLFGGQFAGQAMIDEFDLDGVNGFKIRGIRGGVIPIEENEAIWGDLAGTTLDAAGDINNDGIDDLLIGASHTIINPSRKGVGQTYFIHGSRSAFPAKLRLADLDGNTGFRINGIGTVDYFGVYVRQAGDFNVDGIDDVIIGASGQANSYVVYGRDGGLGRQAPVAPVISGSESSGFQEAALSLGAEAGPLPFRELEDPTGPTPFPPSTSTVLGDPATPNYRPPDPSGSVPAARPQAAPSTSVATPVTTPGQDNAANSPQPQENPVATDNTNDTQSSNDPDETIPPVADNPAVIPSENPPANATDSDGDSDGDSSGISSADDGMVAVGGGGASGGFLFVLLSLAARQRRKRQTGSAAL